MAPSVSKGHSAKDMLAANVFKDLPRNTELKLSILTPLPRTPPQAAESAAKTHPLRRRTGCTEFD